MTYLITVTIDFLCPIENKPNRKIMESEREIYEVIVVGAGIEGSATAYYLAKTGKRTLLLEQFPLPHSRGSSHGHSRITRKAYGARDFYTEMMRESYTMTEELEQECGQDIFVNCGCLVFGPKGDTFVSETEKCLKRHNVPHDKFGSVEQRKRYPNLVLPDEFEFVLDHSGGILRADKMLQAFQSEFVRYGGVIRDSEPMVDLYPGQIVSVKTTKGVHRARSVVLALGPWAAKFLPRIGVHVPLQPVKISVLYWKCANDAAFSIKNFPAILTVNMLGKYDVYALPIDEYPGHFKLCLHHGPNIDPDKRDDVNNDWVLNIMKKVAATHFPTLEKEPSIVEACIYTDTPDNNFILDVHPAWDNVVIGAGFSGHGFKLSPVVGKVLAQLATGEQTSYDMSHFKMDRFFKNKL